MRSQELVLSLLIIALSLSLISYSSTYYGEAPATTSKDLAWGIVEAKKIQAKHTRRQYAYFVFDTLRRDEEFASGDRCYLYLFDDALKALQENGETPEVVRFSKKELHEVFLKAVRRDLKPGGCLSDWEVRKEKRAELEQYLKNYFTLGNSKS